VTALFTTPLWLYLAAILLLSYRAIRANQNTVEDYYLLSRSAGAWLLMGTVTASMANSLAVTGTPSLFYTGGILFFQMFVAVAGACLMMSYFGPKVCAAGQHLGVMTQGELFGSHYQSRTLKWLTGAVGILSIFPFLAIQLAAVGKIFTVGTNSSLSFESAVLLFSTCIGLYIFSGGARAAVWTDSLQGFIAFALFSILAVLSLQWTGGLKSNIDTIYQAMPEKLTFSTSNSKIFVDNILSWTFAFFLWPHLFVRMYMAKNPSEIRKTALYSFFALNALLFVILALTVAATAELYGSLDDPDQLLATMIKIHFPAGGIMLLVLVLALTMSTVDSMLLALSAIASRDFHVEEPRASEASLAKAKALTLCILCLGTLLAVNAMSRSALVPWVTLGASIVTLLLWPLVGMFLLRQNHPMPSILTIGVGFMTICGLSFTELGEGLPIGFATASFLVSASTFALSSVIFRSID